MKVYYKVCLTGEHDEADLLSIGLVASNDLSVYIEVNDYDERKVGKAVAKNVIGEFLGRDGMEDLVVAREKTKGFICAGRQAKIHVNDFFAPHREIALVGYSSIYETAAMARLFNPNNFAKHIHIVNLESEIVSQNSDLKSEVAPELPPNNALRQALFYKQISSRYATEG